MPEPTTDVARILHEWGMPIERSGFFNTSAPGPLEAEGMLFQCQKCGAFRFESDFTVEEWPLQAGTTTQRRNGGEALPKWCEDGNE